MHNNQLKSHALKISKAISCMHYEIDDCLLNMQNSLQSFHLSMNASTNPVLKNCFSLDNETRIKKVLIQYCFLPAEIVNLLNIVREELKIWSSFEFELSRNIDEEMGSRTRGISHYAILADGLKNELGLDISNSTPSLSTNRFINNLKMFFNSVSKSSAAGAIYGIESAAVPELTIVANLLNQYSNLSGRSKTLIDLPASRSLQKCFEGHYSLNLFFAMHLLDFEVGHEKGLAHALKSQHTKSPLNLEEVEYGFEFVLNQMDKWWEDLAIY